jgi:outer membrane immunogenic protein
MRRQLGWALASVISVGFGGLGGAMAADMAVKAAPIPVAMGYNWTGWYVGLNGGGAWGDRTGDLVAFDPIAALAVTAGGSPRHLGANHSGGFGGAQVGYNWQTTNIVFGIETDIHGASIGDTSTLTFPGGGGILPSVSTGRDRIDWFGTFRGRIGFAANNVLFYGTGGLAYGGVRSTLTNVFTPSAAGNVFGSVSDTRVGWAAGAGVEWGFAPNWTVKGEYLHIDLGSNNVTGFDPVNFPGFNLLTYHFHHEFETVRVGVNYRFNGPLVAKY